MKTLRSSREVAEVPWVKSLRKFVIFSSLALGMIGVPLAQAQRVSDPVGDVPAGVPGWFDIVKLWGTQEGRTLALVLETADSIPRSVDNPCKFQILLRTLPSPRPEGPTASIEFDLGGWDGSPWFATNIIALAKGTGLPADTTRLFDWKLGRNSLTIRFSLESLGWSEVEARGRVFYKDGFVDSAPDEGWMQIHINTSVLQGIRTRSSSRAVFSTPERYDSVLTRYNVLPVVDAAYEYELELTGTTPVGGDSVRFVFNPFFGGAAIEGNPIYLGPGMCGKAPLWFVYFHEMGHNFANASARFRQLYPLEMKLAPGPLPTHILFYEGWASLPAMYVFDKFAGQKALPGVADSVLLSVLADWNSTRARFAKAWTTYKQKPAFTALNPDVLDGMFLELQERFGWKAFENFFSLMRPPGEPLPLFDERLAQDTWDLRATRSTLTAAALSVAASVKLDGEFKRWAFPIDDSLFARAYETLSVKQR
jgi:hypothetical protein